MSEAMVQGDSLDFRLLNDYQHDFPLCTAPFGRIAEECGRSEADVMAAFAAFREDGRIARIGAVFAPRRIGASTLAAMRVPAARLTAVAAIVSHFPEVNHNYEREHEFNLWFVATASSPLRLAAVLSAIEAASGLPVLRLPLEEEYHIDLGFALDRLHGQRPLAAAPPAAWTGMPAGPAKPPAVVSLDAGGQALVVALQEGLPLSARPYAMIANRLQIAEALLLARIAAWKDCGILKRFGVVVRHRELGYTANAMLVLDIPDEAVSALGRRLGREPDVTLCYRRPRVLPDWRYNLFCMIHGRERGDVERRIAELRRRHQISDFRHAILFSKTRFKQQGARYVEADA